MRNLKPVRLKLKKLKNLKPGMLVKFDDKLYTFIEYEDESNRWLICNELVTGNYTEIFVGLCTIATKEMRERKLKRICNL